MDARLLPSTFTFPQGVIPLFMDVWRKEGKSNKVRYMLLQNSMLMMPPHTHVMTCAIFATITVIAMELTWLCHRSWMSHYGLRYSNIICTSSGTTKSRSKSRVWKMTCTLPGIRHKRVYGVWNRLTP
jgi:hypothetical protein